MREDAQSLQNASFYSAAVPTLETPLLQRGSLDNDTEDDDHGVADSLVGLAPALLLTLLLISSLLVPFYELRKMGSDYPPTLERPG